MFGAQRTAAGRQDTYLSIHALVAIVIVVDPPVAELIADCDVVAIDIGQSGARWILELRVNLFNFQHRFVGQLLVITPIQCAKTAKLN